ncbi:Tyrosine-protein kinase [Fasciolopsis buskii]|uniref:Tyrosine-protein kinase n=1 Tax=Fasciolopsis buskii TaxID=27845 RepID=A0A8E0RWD4_9TREM|nr:Tyrosine-protein kinase [Fasciolopsis buski]
MIQVPFANHDVPVTPSSDVQHPVGENLNSAPPKEAFPTSYLRPAQVIGDANSNGMTMVLVSEVMRTIPQKSVLPIPAPAPLQSMVRVRALYTYEDLWVERRFARHQRIGESGYVPSDYFLIGDGPPTSLDAWNESGRREADRKLLLVANPVGTYLIRPGSELQNLALSVRHYDRDKNMWVGKRY